MRGVIMRLTPNVVAARWLSHLMLTVRSLPVRYRLKDYNGGSNPEALGCYSVDPKGRPSSDCVGFVLWGSGIDRKQPGYKGLNGEWLNCRSLLADAMNEQRFCRALPQGVEPRLGDWLLSKTHIGGILRPATEVSDILVIDCSPRHGREHAIGIGIPWAKDCVVVRPTFYREG